MSDGEALVEHYVALRYRQLELSDELHDLMDRVRAVASRSHTTTRRPKEIREGAAIENDLIHVHEKMARLAEVLVSRGWKVRHVPFGRPPQTVVDDFIDPMGRHHFVEFSARERWEEVARAEWLAPGA